MLGDQGIAIHASALAIDVCPRLVPFRSRSAPYSSASTGSSGCGDPAQWCLLGVATDLPTPGPPYDRLVSSITSFKPTSSKRHLEKASSWRGRRPPAPTLLHGRLGKEMDAQCD